MKDRQRKWIPIIGWILCFGLFQNCVIVPYFEVKEVSWEHLLTGLGIVLGISGARDIGLKGENKKDEHHNRET